MTQKQIYETALRQSAAELGCMPEDFFRNEPVITAAVSPPDARKYLKLPYPAYFVSYGSNIVASVSAPLRDIAADYLNRYPAAHCFEPPHLHMLHEALAPFGCGVSFTAEYWLPDLNALKPLPCGYELRVLTQTDFAELYLPAWSNALCKKRPELDVLGVGAYDGGRLIGLAGCSADCAEMYQIGIDVLPEYRRRGIAATLTSRLALEILNKDKVPFYCCAWCNLPSARNAVRSGFRPAWTEMQADSLENIAEINRTDS
ncbi:MAG: GNAT family N-acetyltransferase [Oscillospiraceae bacterium]|nr:GNAT family N-acetyltransferase [Oscillospiraceae bacterium]